MLSGKIAQVPELNTDYSCHICTLKLATTESKWNNQTRQEEETQGIIEVKFLGSKADIAAAHCGEGNKIIIEGHAKGREVKTKTGSTFISVEIIGENFEVFDDGSNVPF